MTNPFERGAPTNTPAPARPAGPAAAAGGGVDVKQSSDPYSVSVPSGVSGVKMSDPGILNELLLVEPLEYIPSMMTSASREPTDVIRANFLPLTGELTGQLQEDVLVFQEALKRELKKTFQGPNRWLLAHLHMGTAKPGQSAPYIFSQPDEDQVKIFEKFKAAQGAA